MRCGEWQTHRIWFRRRKAWGSSPFTAPDWEEGRKHAGHRTLNEGPKRGYTITVTAAELDAKVWVASRRSLRSDRGFRRQGSAGDPEEALAAILGDAMQDAIDGAMKAFEKTGDRPAL